MDIPYLVRGYWEQENGPRRQRFRNGKNDFQVPLPLPFASSSMFFQNNLLNSSSNHVSSLAKLSPFPSIENLTPHIACEPLVAMLWIPASLTSTPSSSPRSQATTPTPPAIFLIHPALLFFFLRFFFFWRGQFLKSLLNLLPYCFCFMFFFFFLVERHVGILTH